MAKKDLLFIMSNLHCGGAEKAMISLLESIDYSVYNVDLLLFEHAGLFMGQIPEQVNLLPVPEEYKYFDMPMKAAVKKAIKHRRLDIVSNRIAMGLVFKLEKHPARREQKSWNYLSACFPKLEKPYYAAIGFMEKNPNYYCIEKVDAKRKIGFIHNDYEQLGMDANFDRPYFRQFDAIATVSDECKTVLERNFPEFKSKFHVIGNIILPSLIRRMAKENAEPLPEGIRLFTLGRLVYQKGHDIAIEAAAILKKKGISNFKWYILGEGELKNELKALAKEKGVGDEIVFLGVRENPYSLLDKADIYVQSSRFEGYGIAITEAKILGIPTVLTHFNLAEFHVNHGVDGLIAEMDADSLASQLEILIGDEALRKSFSQELLSRDFGTVAEMEKLYALIENT